MEFLVLIAVIIAGLVIKQDFNSLTKRITLLEQNLKELKKRLGLQELSTSTTEIKKDAVVNPFDATANDDKPQNILSAVTQEERVIAEEDLLDAGKSNLEKSTPKVEESQAQMHAWDEPQTAGSTPLSWLKSWLFSGNPIAKMGVIILFFGVAFLLKYAAQNFYFPITYRLYGVSLAGAFMIFLGWRLHKTRRTYANILQGGGVGLLYLTIFAAFKFYELLPPMLAFTFMLVVVILTGVIAVVQDAKSIALLGILGGFFAPLLIATDQGNYVALFTYYALLNTAILLVAWFKAWRELNLIGFIFTYLVSGLWGYQAYQNDYFYVTEFFLTLFFLFYNVIILLFALRQPQERKGFVDTVLIFGVPVATFTLQIGLVNDLPYGIAYSAFILSGFYFGLAYLIYIARSSSLRVLASAFAMIAVIFATIAIPLTFTGSWAAIDWALEGIVILWIGIQQSRWFARLAAALLQFASGILFFLNMPSDVSPQLFLNGFYLGGTFIALSGLICAYLWYRSAAKCQLWDMTLAKWVFLWGCLWWYCTGLSELQKVVTIAAPTVALMFFAGSSIIFWIASEVLKWVWLRLPALLLLPALIVYCMMLDLTAYSQLQGGVLAGSGSFIILYAMLYRHEKYPAIYLPVLHVIMLWLLTWFVADQLEQHLHHLKQWTLTWSYLAWGSVTSLMLCVLCYARKVFTWPFLRYEQLYQNVGGFPIAVFTLCWFVVANLILSGGVNYIPVLNLLDVTLLFAFVSSLIWFIKANSWLATKIQDYSLSMTFTLFSLLGFLGLNTLLLRTLHQWLHIPYVFADLWKSIVIQAALSIFWTVLALLTTFIAARRHWRQVWFGGALLIAVVIVKLFLVDLSNTSTFARMITFISVGILLLINGYVSPLPPRRSKEKLPK